MKYFLSFILFTFVSNISFGQSSIGIGPNLNIGNSTFAKDGNIGYGVGLDIYFRIFTSGGIRIYGGYDAFRTYTDGDFETRFISKRAGYQHNWNSNKLYAYIDVGEISMRFPAAKRSGLSAGLGTGYKARFGKYFLQPSLNYSINKRNSTLSYNYFTVRTAIGANL